MVCAPTNPWKLPIGWDLGPMMQIMRNRNITVYDTFKYRIHVYRTVVEEAGCNAEGKTLHRRKFILLGETERGTTTVSCLWGPTPSVRP